MFVATGLTHVGAQLDEGEFLDVVDDERRRTAGGVRLRRSHRRQDDRRAVRMAAAARRERDHQRRSASRFAGACRASDIATPRCRPRSSSGVRGWVRNRRDGPSRRWCKANPARSTLRRMVSARSAAGARRGSHAGRRRRGRVAPRFRNAPDRLASGVLPPARPARRCPSTPRTKLRPSTAAPARARCPSWPVRSAAAAARFRRRGPAPAHCA